VENVKRRNGGEKWGDERVKRKIWGKDSRRKRTRRNRLEQEKVKGERGM
jgi:hypothetical protein